MRSRTIGWWLGVAGLLWAMAGPAPAQASSFSWTFELLPADGALSGSPGQTVGWGYRLTNNEPDHWLEAVGLDLPQFPAAVADAAVVLFLFPILGPGETTGDVVYDGLDGLAEILLVGPGQDSSFFTLHANWYDGDPLAGGQPLLEDATLDADASLDVRTTAVPEPSTYLFLTAGGGLLALARSLRREHRRRTIRQGEDR